MELQLGHPISLLGQVADFLEEDRTFESISRIEISADVVATLDGGEEIARWQATLTGTPKVQPKSTTPPVN